jgi:hypothetical protein
MIGIKNVILIVIVAISTTNFSQCLNPFSNMSGASGAAWDDCANAAETYAAETSYGGSNAANTVAEIDALNYLCQSLTGLVIGQTYVFSFRYSRRTNCSVPASVQLDVLRPNGTTAIVLATNAVYGYTTYTYNFVATSTTGTISINVPAAYSNSCGVVVDDVCVALLSALPVVLNDFWLEKNSVNEFVDVKWSTLSEENTKYFIIDKSMDFQNWTQWRISPAAGTTEVEHSYIQRDEAPSLGISYYRLRLMNNDGLERFSEIRSLIVDNYSEVQVYPNPTTGIVQVNADELAYNDCNVYDNIGRVINIPSQKIDEKTILLNFSGFAKGIYFIKIIGSDLLKRIEYI